MKGNRVTALYFGLGLQGERWRTAKIQEHIDEMNAQGWRLLQVRPSSFSLPITWRFFWSGDDDRQDAADKTWSSSVRRGGT